MKARLFAALLFASCAALQKPAEHGHAHAHQHHSHRHHTAHHRFEDAEKWAAVFEDPSRDAWQKPDEVIAALELPDDAKVADIGSGTGYFAVRLARALKRGVVYGADIEPSMEKYLRERAAREGLSNVVAVLAAPDDPKLPEPVDLVLVVDTYHHLSERPAYFARLKNRLRPDGRVAIIDFTLEANRGPPKEHRLAPDVVEREMREAGFWLVEKHGFLPEQYFLVFGR